MDFAHQSIAAVVLVLRSTVRLSVRLLFAIVLSAVAWVLRGVPVEPPTPIADL